MAKQPSEATQLRTLRTTLKLAQMERAEAERQCAVFRARASRAEQDASEWKKRFDLLLEKSPRIDA